MGEKKWEDLTLEEKVEELRRDLLKTMDFVNHVARSGDQIEESAKASKSAIFQIVDHVQKLEKKVQALEEAK